MYFRVTENTVVNSQFEIFLTRTHTILIWIMFKNNWCKILEKKISFFLAIHTSKYIKSNFFQGPLKCNCEFQFAILLHGPQNCIRNPKGYISGSLIQNQYSCIQFGVFLRLIRKYKDFEEQRINRGRFLNYNGFELRFS